VNPSPSDRDVIYGQPLANIDGLYFMQCGIINSIDDENVAVEKGLKCDWHFAVYLDLHCDSKKFVKYLLVNAVKVQLISV